MFVAAVIGVFVALVLSPYLAGLTRTVPDRNDRRWWRPTGTSRPRVAATALIASVLAALAGVGAGLNAELWVYLFAACASAPLVVIDYEVQRLPDRLVFLTGGVGLTGLAVTSVARASWPPLLRCVEAGAIVFAVLFVVILISPRSFGFGDVKLLAVLAGLLGWFGWLPVYYGILAGFVIGAFIGVGQLITRRATMKSMIPFGPSLILGAFLVIALHRTL